MKLPNTNRIQSLQQRASSLSSCGTGPPIERGHLCEFKDSTRLRIYNYMKNKGNKARALTVWLVVFTRVKMLRGSQCAKPKHQQKEVPTSVVALLHRKKRFTSFPSPAGMSPTKLPLGRNNSVMTSLFPPRESLVVTSRLETGNSRTFFFTVYCIDSIDIGIYEVPPDLTAYTVGLKNYPENGGWATVATL